MANTAQAQHAQAHDAPPCLPRPCQHKHARCVLTLVLRRAATCMCGHPGSPLACRDCPWQWKRTPLHNAAYNGNTEVVEVLLAKGADVNAKTKVRREGGGREEGEGEREDTSTGR